MPDFKSLFYPKNIAIIGISSDPLKGEMLLNVLLVSKYPGTIYLINPKYSELFGRKVYPSIQDVPEDVDLAIIAVAAERCPEVIRQCGGKVKFASLFTAGFGELENRELEDKIAEIAREGNVRLLGPNCMGVHCNESRVSFFFRQQAGKVGNIGFISQSGGHAFSFAFWGRGKGIEFNKTVSIGNQCDLTIQDFVEYFGNEPNIKIIGAYIEDVKDGQDFCKRVKQVTKKKPVFVWKGGVTEEGKKAALSHTGAIAIPNHLWYPVMRQIGVVSADSLEELGDLLMSALYLESSYPEGLNVGVLVSGGGSSVEVTDACAREGVHVPRFSSETMNKFSEIMPIVGTIRKNPVDVAGMGFLPVKIGQSIEIIQDDPSIDAIITYQMAERFVWHTEQVRTMGKADFSFTEEMVKEFARVKKLIKKPLICVVPRIVETDLELEKVRIEFINALADLKIPTFPSISRAAKVLVRLNEYVKYLQR